MSYDSRRREFERDAQREDGTSANPEARVLIERMRSSELTISQVKVASLLGDEPATLALGRMGNGYKFDLSPDSERYERNYKNWLSALGHEIGPEFGPMAQKVLLDRALESIDLAEAPEVQEGIDRVGELYEEWMKSSDDERLELLSKESDNYHFDVGLWNSSRDYFEEETQEAHAIARVAGLGGDLVNMLKMAHRSDIVADKLTHSLFSYTGTIADKEREKEEMQKFRTLLKEELTPVILTKGSLDRHAERRKVAHEKQMAAVKEAQEKRKAEFAQAQEQSQAAQKTALERGRDYLRKLFGGE